MNIPLVVWFLVGIPEGTAVTTLAFAIFGMPLKLNKILLSGTTLAVCVYLARLFPIPYGAHIIVAILVIFIFITMFSKGSDIGLSFISSLLGCLALIIVETVNLSLLVLVFGISPQAWFDNQVLRIVFGEISVLFLFISAFLLKLYKKDLLLKQNRKVV